VPLERLFPNAERMASLEEGYRRKYGPEVAEGNTRFLNSDEFIFGSFWHRFELAVYGVWNYPPEANRLGIEGIVPVRITFNRQGTIIKAELLESSGSRLLDEEVLRTLKTVGVVGPLPQAYAGEDLKLIVFFQYTITGGQRSLR
jgi:protein TonB